MKRATNNVPLEYEYTVISIHALVKRATLFSRHSNTPISHFNPRPREEGDNRAVLHHPLARISIHALVKRATNTALLQARSLKHFNPRPREEGDTALTAVQRWTRDFNPRPREEGDDLVPEEMWTNVISIHALVKRATRSKMSLSIISSISIHALVKRATLLTTEAVPPRTFQSTPS